MSNVDLVVNTWERTYRDVVKPGFFPSIEVSNGRKFKKILLINNVDNMSFLKKAADELIHRNELDEYFVVEEELPKALMSLGLTLRDLGRVPHYSDAPLVAITLPSTSDYLLYWDSEITLYHQCNWVDISISLMENNPNILCVNPSWHRGSVAKEAIFMIGDFSVGYGFFDQCFLIRMSDIDNIAWNCFCVASLRYPLSHIAPVFEQRIDAFMRRTHRLRATYTKAVYVHPNEGMSYPSTDLAEKIRRIAFNALLRLLDVVPGSSSPCLKINPKPSYRFDHNDRQSF